jgi:hypothetical protein
LVAKKNERVSSLQQWQSNRIEAEGATHVEEEEEETPTAVPNLR